MNPKEILIAGVWCASAVTVAAYTWESFGATGGWSNFPQLGASGAVGEAEATGSQSPLVRLASNALGSTANSFHHIPVIGGTIDAVDKFLGNLLATNYVSQDEEDRLAKLQTPPIAMVRAVAAAKQRINSGHGTSQDLQAVNTLNKWLLAHRWLQSDVNSLFKFMGINVL